MLYKPRKDGESRHEPDDDGDAAFDHAPDGQPGTVDALVVFVYVVCDLGDTEGGNGHADAAGGEEGNDAELFCARHLEIPG